MAIQTLKCPNCNGELQLDDSFEKGFCMYCGGAIQIKDDAIKIKVEHGGKIEIDDTKKLASSLTLADRAFEAGNYEECYNYCCMALECDTDNAHSAFRKGLCAAYISTARTTELEQALKTAIEIINNTSDNTDNDIYVIFSELFDYIESTYILNCKREKGFKYPSLAAANNYFSIIAILTKLCAQCSELISDEMILAHPIFENDKKNCLEKGIELCEQGMSSIKYFSGYTQVKKGDSYVKQEVYKTANSPHLEVQKSYLAKFKNDFNNLPTIKKALLEYNREIENLQKDIDVYTKKLEEYFSKNTEIAKQYKKSALPFIIPTGVIFLLTIMAGAAWRNTLPDTVFGVIMILFLCAFAVLAVLSIFYTFTYSKQRKKILNELPPELSCLKSVHDQSKIKLQSVNQKKTAFEKKNLKR